MLKLYKNNLIEEINGVSEEEMDYIDSLVFTKNDIEKLSVLEHAEFKYRPWNEYRFIDCGFYKLYFDEQSDAFNVCRLNEYEIDSINQYKKISDIIFKYKKIEEIIDFEITEGYDPTLENLEIIEENEDFLIISGEYEYDDEYYNIIMYKQKEKESVEYDYKKWFIRRHIKETINDLFLFSPEHNSFIVQLGEGGFLPINTHKIEKYLFENYEKIENETGLKNIKLKVFTHSMESIEKFRIAATKTEKHLEHSWAGSSYNKVTFYTLQGEIKYGIDREYEYSNNGNIGTPDITKELPDFKIHRREPIIFIRKNFHYDSLSGNRDDSIYRNTEYTIVIYY